MAIGPGSSAMQNSLQLSIHKPEVDWPTTAHKIITSSPMLKYIMWNTEKSNGSFSSLLLRSEASKIQHEMHRELSLVAGAHTLVCSNPRYSHHSSMEALFNQFLPQPSSISAYLSPSPHHVPTRTTPHPHPLPPLCPPPPPSKAHSTCLDSQSLPRR